MCVCVCVCVHQRSHTNTHSKSLICSHKLSGLLQSASALRKALRRSACLFSSVQHAQISSVSSEEQKTSVTADVAAVCLSVNSSPGHVSFQAMNSLSAGNLPAVNEAIQQRSLSLSVCVCVY